jgi:hypothetical protein
VLAGRYKNLLAFFDFFFFFVFLPDTMTKIRTILFVGSILSPLASASLKAPITCTISSLANNATLAENCEVLCQGAKWTDVAVFYIGNYFAHIATIRSLPGQSGLEGIQITIFALLFPLVGLAAALRAILSLAVFEKTPLRTAAKAGALYMVIEDMIFIDDMFKDEMSRFGTGGAQIQQDPLGGHDVGQTHEDEIQPLPDVPPDSKVAQASVGDISNTPEANCDLLPVPAPASSEPSNTKEQRRPSLQERPLRFVNSGYFPKTVHGRVSLPVGWMLSPVSINATFDDDEHASTSTAMSLTRNYEGAKALVAVAQTLFGISTLYTTSISEVHQLGYVAFGFTVIPFTFMSFINILANMTCPTYPAIYLVENRTLHHLRQQIASEGKQDTFYVEGAVGTLKEDEEDEEGWENNESVFNLRRMLRETAAYVLVMLIFIGVLLGVMGGLTGFQKAASTLSQRVWIMFWLIYGTGVGVYGGLMHLMKQDVNGKLLDLGLIFGVAVHSTIAVGGYVVVGQMILQVGVCQQIN